MVLKHSRELRKYNHNFFNCGFYILLDILSEAKRKNAKIVIRYIHLFKTIVRQRPEHSKEMHGVAIDVLRGWSFVFGKNE
jgi:hypothetical protein